VDVMGSTRAFRLFLAFGIILIPFLSSCSREQTDLNPPAAAHVEEATPTAAPTDTPTSTNIADYRLVVDGLVDRPLSLTYESILQYPAVSDTLWLICPGVFENQNEWTGVPLSLILDEAGTKAEATKTKFVSPGGYSAELSIEDARKEGTFLAYKVDGQVLGQNDGYPLRLVVKDQIGSVWVKFLEHIEVK
jgi:DMSO/TMAO reductase YedYZ molybdopterin-dependent catalytic subunit